MTKWKWELLMIIAALALLLAMPALVAAADQGQGVRNAEMAAADAKASADKAEAAAERAMVAAVKVETSLIKKKTAEVAPSAVKMKMAANVPKQIMGKATKAQYACTYPSMKSLACAAAQRYYDLAAIATTESLTGKYPIAGAGCESSNFKFETDLRANKVATPLLTFKTTSALDNLKAKAGEPMSGQTQATPSSGYAALQLDQQGSAACAPAPAMNC